MDDRYIFSSDTLRAYMELNLLQPKLDRSISRCSDWGIGLGASQAVRIRTRECPKDPQLSLKAIPNIVLDCPGLRDDFYVNLLDWSARNIISIALDRSVYAYNYETHQSNFVLSTEGVQAGYISSVKSSPSGDQLIVGNSSGCLVLFDVKKNQQVRRLELPAAHRIAVLEWASTSGEFNSHVFIAGDQTGKIHYYDVRPKKSQCLTQQCHDQEVCGLSMSLDGHTLASGGNDNKVTFSDIRTRKAIYELDDFGAAIRALSWCPGRTGLIAMGTGMADRRILVWCSTSNTFLAGKTVDAQVTGIFWESDCHIVSIHGSEGNEIILSDYPSLQSVCSVRAHDIRILQSAISPDRKYLATAAPDECLKVWSLVSRKCSSGDYRASRKIL